MSLHNQVNHALNARWDDRYNLFSNMQFEEAVAPVRQANQEAALEHQNAVDAEEQRIRADAAANPAAYIPPEAIVALADDAAARIRQAYADDNNAYDSEEAMNLAAEAAAQRVREDVAANPGTYLNQEMINAAVLAAVGAVPAAAVLPEPVQYVSKTIFGGHKYLEIRFPRRESQWHWTVAWMQNACLRTAYAIQTICLKFWEVLGRVSFKQDDIDDLKEVTARRLNAENIQNVQVQDGYRALAVAMLGGEANVQENINRQAQQIRALEAQVADAELVRNDAVQAVRDEMDAAAVEHQRIQQEAAAAHQVAVAALQAQIRAQADIDALLQAANDQDLANQAAQRANEERNQQLDQREQDLAGREQLIEQQVQARHHAVEQALNEREQQLAAREADAQQRVEQAVAAERAFRANILAPVQAQVAEKDEQIAELAQRVRTVENLLAIEAQATLNVQGQLQAATEANRLKDLEIQRLSEQQQQLQGQVIDLEAIDEALAGQIAAKVKANDALRNVVLRTLFANFAEGREAMNVVFPKQQQQQRRRPLRNSGHQQPHGADQQQ